MRRHPRPASGATCHPRSRATLRASSSVRKAPIGFVGSAWNAGSSSATSTRVSTVAVGSEGSTAVSACWSR